MSAYVEHVQPFLRKTPFHPRIEPLMHGNHWMRWTGHYAPAAFESVQSEYFTIRNGASVFDVSPLIKYTIRGRQAAEYVNHLITRDLSKIKPMQAFYTAWCQDDGMLVEEGTIFRLGENDFLLNSAKDQLHWLEQTAYGFDVEIEEASNALCGLSIQGPTSRDVLRAFGINSIDQLKRFGIMELELNGNWLRIDRAGFTGDLGYEIWTRPESALWLWDRLFEVGRDHKIAPIGYQALEIARIEAGFILIDADYSASIHALRPSNRMSPYELGIGWTVNLNKPGYFVGKRALKREKELGTSRYILTGLEIEGRKPAGGAFLYADQAGKKELGLVTSGCWSPTMKKNLGFARIPTAYAKAGTEMWIEIWSRKEQKIERSMLRCWATNRMFYDPPRKSA
jgi:aminomethyltransferase